MKHSVTRMLTRIAALFALLLAAATPLSAQDLAAILMHDGTPTVFKGIDGLKQAHDAAADGDIISLSAGTFNGCDITKGVTIIGSGIGYNGTPTTTINSSFTIKNIPDNQTVTIKSVDCSFRVATTQPVIIEKAWLHLAQRPSDFTGKPDVSISQSRIDYQHIPYARLNNCVIESGGASGFQDAHDNIATNCTYKNYPGKNAICYNCIICLQSVGSTCQYSSWTLSNCLINSNLTIIKNWAVTNGVNCLFYGFDNSLSNFFTGTNWFKIKDEYVIEYLGSDGTQVGAHGGATPFNPISPLPVITNFSVADKTTPEGVLNVEMTVEQ